MSTAVAVPRRLPLFPPLDAPAHVLAAAAAAKALERDVSTVLQRDNILYSQTVVEVKKIFTRFMMYQQTNNIQHRCASNVYFVLRLFRANGIWCFRAKALFALVVNPAGEVRECIAHLALISDREEVLDPSYDMFSREGVQYVGDMKELMDIVPTARTQFEKEGFVQYLELAKFANLLNHVAGIQEEIFDDPYLDEVDKVLGK